MRRHPKDMVLMTFEYLRVFTTWRLGFGFRRPSKVTVTLFPPSDSSMAVTRWYSTGLVLIFSVIALCTISEPRLRNICQHFFAARERHS